MVAHPHIPPTFRPGIEVSNIFLMMGPYAVVSPDGRTQSTKYNRNPGIVPAIAGGIAGSLVASAMSNPGPAFIVIDSIDGTVMYTKRATGTGSEAINSCVEVARRLARKNGKSYIVCLDMGRAVRGSQVNVGWARAMGITEEVHPDGSSTRGNPPRTRKGAEKLIDDAIGRAWAQLMSGVQVPIMDIPRIFRDIKLEMAGGADLETAVRAVGGRYRVNRNPRGKMCEHGMVDQRRCRGCRTRKHARRRTALCPHGISGGKIGRDCVRCVEKRYGYKRNGSGARKVTMPIEKFAKLVKAQNDPALWRDFVAKCKAYHKWSHGTWPKKATIEAIQKPGMKGMWISFDMGREPEKTYVMPKGTKRKGAWKHPWERMPQLRGDAEAGFILTKLGKGNRLTDFLHG